MSSIDVIAAAPYAMLSCAIVFILLLDLFRVDKKPFPRLLWGVGSCVGTAILFWPFFRTNGAAFSGAIEVDAFTCVLSMIILAGTTGAFLLNEGQLEKQRIANTVDVDVLVLLATLGGLVMVAAGDLMTLFVGFELLSISVYALTGSARTEQASAEGALKYFVLGAFSSAFMLYGMALVYGVTGTLNIAEIGNLVQGESLMLLLGIGLMIFGLGFKVSLVPFHFWTPDVYHGAPSSIAGYMAVVVKAAAFGCFFRVMFTAFGSVSGAWSGMITVLAILSMTVGNIVALRQSSLKRMLAYSSIAHAGYAMIGFLVMGTGGGEAIVFYLVVYSLMTLGAFGVVVAATSGSEAQYNNDDLSSLEGLGWSRPLLGIAMTVAMLSLAGVPPLGGFMGKFYLFSSAVRGGYVALAIFAALNSVISLYYYLRVVVVMYFSEERTLSWEPPLQALSGVRVALVVATFGTLFVGLFSERYYQAARVAILSLS